MTLSKTAQSYARLFAQGRVDEAALARAVQRGLMTREECEEILGQEAPAAATKERENT